MLGSSTRIGLMPGTSTLTLDELRNIIDSLKSLLMLPLAPVKQEAYREQSHILQSLIYINVGVDPMAALSARGMHKISSRSDSLGYSAMRENLVLTLDQVVRNSWNELMVSRYELGDTLIQCLKNTLAQIAALPAGKPLPDIEVRCFCQSRATAIAKRVEVLFKDVIAAFFGKKGSLDCRYVIELDRRYFVIHFADGSPGFTGFNTLDQLVSYLGFPQRVYSAIVIDRYALEDARWLKTLVEQVRAESIQIFFRVKENSAEVFVSDELGSLCRYYTAFHDTRTLLLPLWRFLQSIKERRQIRAQADVDWLGMDIFFYQLNVDLTGAVSVAEITVGDVAEPPNYFEVQAIGSRDFDGNLSFDMFCDQQEFSALEYGDQLVPAVAHFIVSRRRGGGLYPCYVTDVGLPHDINQSDYQMNLQTVQYLQYKLAIEQALNQAIAAYDNP
jgi:adenylate cyclase class 1